MKMNIKIILLICILGLCQIPTEQSYAITTNDDMAGKYVETFVAQYDASIQVNEKETLYNENGEKVALLYTLFPKGYIVIDAKDHQIIEYSWTAMYPYIKGEINYYNGPLQYYIKREKRFQHSRTGNYIDFTDYSTQRLSFEEMRNHPKEDDTVVVMANQLLSNSLGTSLRTFDYNPDERCGSVAASILFAYYDDVIDSSMVSSYLLADATGQRFSDYLKPHIEDLDGQPGSYVNDVVSGMSWYIATKGLYMTYSVYSVTAPQYITFVNCINIGRPVIVNLNAHPTYRNHWVVGYRYQYSNAGNFVTVNDGWGSNGISINWTYVRDLVFLNKPEL